MTKPGWAERVIIAAERIDAEEVREMTGQWDAMTAREAAEMLDEHPSVVTVRKAAIVLRAAIEEIERLTHDNEAEHIISADYRERAEAAERERDALQKWKDDDLLDWDKLEAQCIQLQAGEVRMRDHVRWLLPLAKGYVAAHPGIASTQRIIENTEMALSIPPLPIERLIEAAQQLLKTISILGGANEPAELDRRMIGQDLADALSAIGFGDKP
jgi:bacterioferritin (cytochrome b1)